ncbi:MAG: lytic transglycosylase domain-containing protein [Saprospiraceae bacterium]
MNKILLIASQYNKVLIWVFLISILSSFSVSASSDDLIEGRILSLNSSVDIKYNKEVGKRVKQYTVKQRKTTEILLGRVSIYFSTFENILREEGLPDDLKYLAVIESGLRPRATSRSGAAGLWQFMKPTGRMMGLDINRTIDERRDVKKSTRAAAKYLKHLHDRFGDWTLALAAYNCGPGNLRKAIRKSGGHKDFWKIQKYLPKETRQYIPKFIAISYVMNYYYEHDLVANMPDQEMLFTSSAQVFQKISFKGLSNDVGVDLETIKNLNPSYIKNYIPKSKEGKYDLILPTHNMIHATNNYHVLARIPNKRIIEIVKIVEQLPRDIVKIQELVKDGKGKKPASIRQMRLHFVTMGNNNEKIIERPNSYKINSRQKTISDIGHIIKNVKRTL